MQAFLRIYLPLFLLFYFLTVFALPTYRVYKRTGLKPLTFGRGDGPHDYVGRWMKAVMGALFVAVILYAAGAVPYSYLSPLSYMEHPITGWTGLLLLHLSTFWILLAQDAMRDSWRIGIDEAHATALVSTGLFRYSRNPVFLGMIGSTAAVFLILPNALTLLVAVTSYLLIGVQIRLEEAHLLKLHGDAYTTYKQQVRRLV